MLGKVRPRVPGGTPLIVSTGLTFLLTLELLRAWAVSLPLLYQGFTSASPVLLGLGFFSPFLAGFVAALVFVRWRLPWWALVPVAAGARLTLQFIGGGFWALTISLIGLAACLCMLIQGAPRRQTILGLVAALAADAILLMALKTESLVFRNSTGALVGTVALLAAFAASRWWGSRSPLTVGRKGRSAATRLEPAWSRGSVWAWVAFGAVLVLHLTVASLPAPLETATGWSAGAARMALAASYAAGAILALWATECRSNQLVRAAPRVVALAAIGVSLPGLMEGSATWHIVMSAALPVGLLVGLASLSGTSRTVRPLVVRLAAASAFTMGVAVPFAYYLSFVVRYGFEPKWLLVGTAGLLALVVGSGAVLELLARQRSSLAYQAPVLVVEWRRPTRRWIRAALLIVAGTALVVVLPGVSLGASGPRVPSDFPVRIVSYNIFMGLGADVNLDLDRLAGQIACETPDVIALQEVSRGWFTSGSVDLLPRLAERLGYSYHFFPAADDAWGNAILTDLPSEEYTENLLPRGTAAMRRGWGSALLKLGDGQRLLVVASHLYDPRDGHTLRAEQAAALVKGTLALADRYKLLPYTVVVGDMNAETDSVELTPVRSMFWDAFSADPLPTYPSWAPNQRIDHVFIGKGLQATDRAVFGGPASDHLGIAVTIEPAGKS